MNIFAEAAAEQPLGGIPIGPPPTRREIFATIVPGVVSLLLGGVVAIVLGALQDEHRLSAAGIGLCATLEALVMAIVTGAAAAALPPRHLRLIGIVSSLALGVLDLATMGAQSTAIMVLRTLAGIPDGILLWLTIGMIARSAVPARWAGVFLAALTASQLGLALAYVWVIPRFGADGAFAGLAITAFAGIVFAFWLPKSYAPLPKPENESGMPPPRGWIALFASLLIMASIGAVGTYLQPLAHQAGLDAGVARTAVWVSLMFQIAGGSLATALAHRLHWFPAFVISMIGFVLGWAIFDFQVSALVFVLANSCVGFMGLFIGPFIVPMTIEADPSLRAAMQSAGAQVLGAAIGPALAIFVIGDQNVHGAIFLGVALLLAGMIIVTGLHLFAMRERHALAAEKPSAPRDPRDVLFEGTRGAPVTISADEGGDHAGHERVAQ